MKIFISYNHKDQPAALMIRNRLTEAGFEILIDQDSMRAGADIGQFISSSLRDSSATLFLISAQSLMSAWVAMETVAGRLDEQLDRRYFLPCYLDTSFMDRDFTTRAMEKAEAELQEIDALVQKALEKGWGSEDLNSERTRYLDLKAHLPEIIGRLRNSGCVDLSPEHFEAGMEKIIRDLKAYNAETSQPPPPLPGLPAGSLASVRDSIVEVMDEYSKERLSGITQRLARQRELLEQYELEQDLETDPRRQMRNGAEIARIRKSIQSSMEEIKSL